MQLLQYLEHEVDPDIKCSICFEDVAADAVQLSCHDVISCSECIGHWLGSQIHRELPPTCPFCRARIDTCNLRFEITSSDDNGDELYSSFEDDFYGQYQISEPIYDAEVARDDVATRSGQETQNDFTSYHINNDQVFEDEMAVYDDAMVSFEPEHLMNKNKEDLPSMKGRDITGAGERDQLMGKEHPSENIYEDASMNFSSSVEDSSDSEELTTDEEAERQQALALINEDDGTPKGYLRNCRYKNITLRCPSYDFRCLLWAVHDTIPNPYSFDLRPCSYNTIYASNLKPSTAFMLAIEYGISPAPVDYYFIWVTGKTTFGEIAHLWRLITVGEYSEGYVSTDAEVTFLLTKHHLVTGKFERLVLGMGETVEGAGLEHGSSFTIPAACA